MSEPNQIREWKSFATREEAEQFWRDNTDYQGVVECPSDPSTGNEETRRVIAEIEKGIGLVRSRNVEELFRELGID